MPDTAVWNPQYHQIVLATDPITCWLQDEKQRNVAYDWVRRRQGSDQDGAYTGVTLYEPGIGDGRASPFFDGANDFNNIFTAAFQGRFNGSEGTVMVWAKAFNAGVWTDLTARRVITLQIDSNNRIFIQRHNNNNQLRWLYEAGNVIESIITLGHSDTGWMCFELTWSKLADQVIAYKNGLQEGGIQVGLGVWAGNLVNGVTLIGAANVAGPVSVWHGNISHAAVWDRPLTPAEILYLYEQGVF